MCATVNTYSGAAYDNQRSASLPSVLLLVSPGFEPWVKEGLAKRYCNVMLTVRITDNVTTVGKIAAGYARERIYFDGVCLTPCHGHEEAAALMWKNGAQWTLAETAVKAAAKITRRVHIITCWQGLFLQSINVPGIVLSGYNTWMNTEKMRAANQLSLSRGSCNTFAVVCQLTIVSSTMIAQGRVVKVDTEQRLGNLLSSYLTTGFSPLRAHVHNRNIPAKLN
jgi:hypothetical protein